MKVLHLFIAVCVLVVSAQRRPLKQDDNVEATSHKTTSRSRGRTRFSLTPEYEQANEEYKSVPNIVSHRKPENAHYTERKPLRSGFNTNSNRRSYEVREIIDDIPRETPPKLRKKPHVITETKFEATNASKKDTAVPSPIPVEDLIIPKSTSTQMPSVELSTEKTIEENVTQSSEGLKVEPEVKKEKISDRQTIRLKNNVSQKIDEPARVRTRNKFVQREEQHSSTISPSTLRTHVRVNRRRPEPTPEIKHNSLRTKGPSVFSADAAELSTRSRPGRRVTINTAHAIEQIPEDTSPINLIPSRRRLVERIKSPSVVQDVTESIRRMSQRQIHKDEQRDLSIDVPKIKKNADENTVVSNQRRDFVRGRQIARTTAEPVKNAVSTSKRPDVRRGRTTDAPATTSTVRRSGSSREISHESSNQQARTRNRVKTSIDNPDSVVTNPTRNAWARRRQSSASIDDIDAASTKQTEVKIKIDSLNDDVNSQNVKVSLEKSFSVETKPGRIRKRPNNFSTTTKSNENRESSSDVADHPSKIALLNLRNSADREERGPKVSTQAGRPKGRTSTKKIKNDSVTNSQEVIDESDNYPAPFKAALKAKKNEGHLGSRTNNVNEVSITKTTEATVTSSIPSTSLKTFPYAASVASTTNEEASTSRSFRYTRPRFSLTTKSPKLEDVRDTKKHSQERSKYAPSSPPHHESVQKFHARYKSSRTQTENSVASERPLIKPRTYVPKPPKGIYSSRKFTRIPTSAPDTVGEFSSKYNLEQSSLSTKVPSIGLSAKNRFSARYRNEILPKSVVHRVSTTVPSYIPTVPTVTPSSSTDHFWQEEDMTEYYSWYSNRIN